MSLRLVVRITGLLWILAGLSACGGGGGVTLGGGIGGTGKPGVKVGTVTDATTLTVSGTSFTSGSASVTVDGLPATPAEVRDGMTAKVTGLIDGAQGIATEVEVEDVAQGPISAKLDAQRFTVLGQTVEVDEATVFGSGIVPASLDGLSVGDLVEVYGFVKAPGVLRATRVQLDDSLGTYRVMGFAAAVDESAMTFSIGAIVVDYGSAEVSQLPGGHPADGMLVRVRALNVLGALGELLATRVRPEDLEDSEDNDETEIEGFVTAVLSPTQFVIGSVVVDISPATQFENGTAADIVVGAQLEAEGALVGGALEAREVKFEGGARLESDVESIGAGTFTLVGLPGVTVSVDALTEYDEDASAFAELAVGDHVEVRGRIVGASSVVAIEVKETDPDTDVRLRGPVDASPAPADPLFHVLGVSVDTSGRPDSAFEGEDGLSLGRAAFFAALTPGTLVEAQGQLSSGIPTWQEFEIEND